MQLHPSFAASVVGAFTSAGLLEIFEVLPWRRFLGLAVRSCLDTQFGQCVTQEDLAQTLQHERFAPEYDPSSCPECPELKCGSCPPAVECPKFVCPEPVEDGFTSAAYAGISLAIVLTWVACFAVGRWSAKRGGGGRHPTMGLGRPPTRARAVALPEGGVIPSLARRGGAR